MLMPKLHGDIKQNVPFFLCLCEVSDIKNTLHLTMQGVFNYGAGLVAMA